LQEIISRMTNISTISILGILLGILLWMRD